MVLAVPTVVTDVLLTTTEWPRPHSLPCHIRMQYIGPIKHPRLRTAVLNVQLHQESMDVEG